MALTESLFGNHSFLMAGAAADLKPSLQPWPGLAERVVLEVAAGAAGVELFWELVVRAVQEW